MRTGAEPANTAANQVLQLDPLLPRETAAACEAAGVRKAGMDAISMFVLAGLAGAFVSLGAVLYTVTVSGPGLGFGATRLLGGAAFSLGLVLVIIAGAELFTGNTLIIMAWASRRVSTSALLRNWLIVYAGNTVGALLTVLLVYGGRQWELGDGAVGGSALRIASAKVQLGFGQALALGILCNALVALAVWLAIGGRSNTDRILSIVFPITAFVAAGFEHSIANLYFAPMGILLKDQSQAVAASGLGGAQLADLTWARFLLQNLLPVTIGNIIGGAVLVGAVYWFVYLRRPAGLPEPGRD